ncbi:hypothetical protein [Anaeroselena agilis]|uniref:Uncharacterized protein n=1 Tax=Anaeroselena agilis TaxID=3063788 RepID=A0ABU3NXA6_9FIRM|nr:hypothetical protein [Selenomonadales bacterium 4137-cl]
MEEAERRREAPSQPLRTVYRPVDPGLKARILRQFGQPYDESAIPKGQEFYLNGWDNGDEDDTLVEQNRRMERAPLRNGAMGREEPDPWSKAWKLDWGEEGRPEEKARTMEPQTNTFMYRGKDNDRDFSQFASGAPDVRQYTYDEGLKRADSSGSGIWGKAAEVAKGAIKLNKFGDKAYNVAKEQGYGHEDAMEIAREAQIMHGIYLGGDAYLGRRLKGFKYFIKEVGRELTEDELQRYFIETTINNRKLRQNPPEGSILPP